MSNLVPFTTNIPAHLANRVGQPSALAQALAGGIAGGESFPRISIKGSRFRIIEGGAETVLNSTTLDVIIVGANPRLSKAWYAKEWNKDAEPAAPDCFSLDGVKPNVDAVDPQHDLCAGCPQNAWGSKVTATGQQIKACSDKKRLAVVAADDASGPVYLLEVTPAALKGLNIYQKELSMRGIAPEIVRTRVSFDTDASFPKLQFGFGGFLDEESMTAVDAIAGSDNILEITGQKSTGTAPAVPAAAPKPQLVKAAAKPAPAPEPEVVEEEEAPAPKRGFGAAKAAPAAVAKAAAPKVAAKAPAPASSLADEIAALVDEMADDA
tara:strand:+ start:477 stop:1445 length:969 start_codon:yes stop_codon:yes gene_type:complete